MDQKDLQTISQVVRVSISKNIPKFHRKGIFKSFDTFSQIKRTILGNFSIIRYYWRKDLMRLAATSLIYIFVVNYAFRTLHFDLQKKGINVDNIELSGALLMKTYDEENDYIIDAMLMQSVLHIFSYDIKSLDKDSLAYAYSLSLDLLSKNSEMSIYWPKICKKIISKTLNTRANEILLNYKTLSYYSSKVKNATSISYYVHEFYRAADKEYKHSYIPNINTGSDLPEEIFVKLAVCTDLIKQFESTNSEYSAIAQIKEKYLGCYSEIERNFKLAIDECGLKIEEDEIKKYSTLLYIMYINSLHRSIGVSINKFELENTTLASMATPVYYRFRDHSAEIMYEHITFLNRMFILMGSYIEVMGAITYQENIFCIGDYMRIYAHNTQFKTILPKIGNIQKDSRTTLFNFVKAIIVKLSAFPSIQPNILSSRPFVNNLLKEFDKYSPGVESYDNALNIQYYAIWVYGYVCASILMSLPAFLCFFREDFGKYLFVYTTHEAWIGYSITQITLISALIYGLAYGVTFLAYLPRLDFIGYVAKYEYIVNLYRPIILTYVRDTFITGFLNIWFYFMLSLSCLYIMDYVPYLRCSLYINNVYYAYTFLVGLMELYSTYGVSCDHISFNNKIFTLGYKLVKDTYGGISILKNKYVVSSIGLQNISYMRVLNVFYNSYMQRIFNPRCIMPIVIWLIVMSIYLRVKTWNWYFTPEEIIVR